MSRRRDTVVGLAILGAVLLAAAGTLWLKGEAFGREEMSVSAVFREVGQLRTGARVRYRGVPIGRVEGVALAESGDWVLVTMTMASEVALPEDPVVILSPESFFGDWQAEITSRRRYPRYSYAEPLTQGVLPGASLPDISQLTAVADRIAENLAVLSERVEIAFTEETALKLREAIENISEVSQGLTGLVARQERALGALSEDLETAAQTLSDAAEAVRRITAEVEVAIAGGQVSRIVGNLDRATAQLDTLTVSLQRVSGNFEGTMESADSAFVAVSRVARSISEGEGTLGQLVQDTTLYAELVRTNDQLQSLLEDFRRNPRRYINLEIF